MCPLYWSTFISVRLIEVSALWYIHLRDIWQLECIQNLLIYRKIPNMSPHKCKNPKGSVSKQDFDRISLLLKQGRRSGEPSEIRHFWKLYQKMIINKVTRDSTSYSRFIKSYNSCKIVPFSVLACSIELTHWYKKSKFSDIPITKYDLLWTYLQ